MNIVTSNSSPTGARSSSLAVWEYDTSKARALYEDLLEDESEHTRDAHLASLVRLGLAGLEILEGRDPGPWLAQCEPMLTDLGSDAMTWLYRVLLAARDWQERPEHARAVWTEAAAYFERTRFTIPAKAAHTLVEVMDGRPLGEVARDLANATARFHPLPERVRQAESRDEAIRAIIALVMN